MVAPIWSLRRVGINITPREQAAYQVCWRHIGFVPLICAPFLRVTPFSQLLPRHTASTTAQGLRLEFRSRRDLLCLARIRHLPVRPASFRPAQHAPVQDPLVNCESPPSPIDSPAPYRVVSTLPRSLARGPARPAEKQVARVSRRRRRDVDGMELAGVWTGVREGTNFGRAEGEELGEEEAEVVPMGYRARRRVRARGEEDGVCMEGGGEARGEAGQGRGRGTGASPQSLCDLDPLFSR